MYLKIETYYLDALFCSRWTLRELRNCGVDWWHGRKWMSERSERWEESYSLFFAIAVAVVTSPSSPSSSRVSMTLHRSTVWIPVSTVPALSLSVLCSRSRLLIIKGASASVSVVSAIADWIWSIAFPSSLPTNPTPSQRLHLWIDFHVYTTHSLGSLSLVSVVVASLHHCRRPTCRQRELIETP